MRQRIVRRRSPRQLLLSALLIVLLGIPVTIALVHQGFPASDVQVTARAVWVTNASDATAGRLNARIQELDASVSMPNADVTVLQDGETVFLHDRVSGSFGRVDPAYTDVRESISTPPGSTSAMGGGRIALVEPAEGRVWTLQAGGPLSFDTSTAEPDLVLGPGAQISVTPAGAVIGFSPASGLITRLDRPGAAPQTRELGGPLPDAELTTVGERAFVLDRAGNRMLAEDASVTAFGEAAVRIQLPGPESSRVVLAAENGLVEVPIDGGPPHRLGPDVPGGGRSLDAVAQPVNIGECAHGAWASSSTVLRQCAGPEPEVQHIEQAIEGPVLFRVNRDVVALNDIRSGNTWLPQEHLRLVENWQDIVPPKDQQGGDGDQEASEESFEDTLSERTDENHPPELIDDRFGVRAGAVASLPVLDNDTDPDGDIITITEVQGNVPESMGKLNLVDQGRALQFEAAPGASGEITIVYRGTDGRPGGVAQANVTISVLGGEDNQPPVQRHTATVTVEAGKQTTYNVLADWQDPDGDPVYLQSASPTDGSAVSFTPDGRITFTATGAELGQRTVSYTVSDGKAQTQGTLTVEVGAPGTLDPIGTPDFSRGLSGSTITAQPLVNDLSPSGSPLEIVEVRELGSATGGVSLNTELGTVSYRGDVPGTYYVQYTLRAGANDSIGLIRFDVLDPESVDGEIAAVQDVAFVRPEQSTTVPVLANDMSVSGDVLSVQTVELSDQARVAGIALELIENQLVRITAPTPFPEPIKVGYTVTDGERMAQGTVVLVPVEPVANHQPPIARDDTRKVRVGDYTSVPVLANDVHPDAASMTLDHELRDQEIADGFAFTSGDRVRFQAPREPGSYSLSYVVTDEYGEQASARVTFQVVADDEGANRPPEPADQTVRVFEGSSTLVNVPVTGIDPDGDSGSLKSVLTAPTLGTVRDETETSFVYEAFPGSAGTDELRYEIVDGYGQRAEGLIRVAVVPRAEQTLPPVAVDDRIVARPGSLVAVPVLGNDSDPGGYPVELVDDFSEADPAFEARIDGEDDVLLRVPEEGTFATLPYTITNGHGGSDHGWINITIDPKAPLAAPTASDQTVPASAFDGREEAVVNVRDGAKNPTGRVLELQVELSGPGAELARVDADGTVRVKPSDKRQIIAFTLTSPESGLSGSGFIMVPRRVTDADKRQSPYLRPDLPQQQTRVDTPIRWNVNDLVVADSGNRISIIEPDRAWAEQSNGSPVAVGGEELQFVPKPGFRGTASITFLVTDATGPDDSKAGIATIRLQITVGDPDLYDVAPTFVTPQISVEAGTETTFDLASATGHPNPEVIPQVSFSGLGGQAGGVTASIEGQQLRVTAAIQAAVGTIVPLQLNYSFREFTKTGTVNVTVVSSSQPPPRTAPDETVALRGETLQLDVLSNDFNPFPEAPLRLLEVTDVSASATGAVLSAVSGRVQIATGATFIGEISIRYRIGDGTQDPNREAYGTASVRVRDVPSAPTSASLAADGPSRLRASWDLATANGEPIEEYQAVLTPQGGGSPIVRSAGDAGSYVFTAEDGLVSGTPYTLQVRARNSIGWGPLSNVSDAAVPLDRPSAPRDVAVHDALAAPGATSGDLRITWGAPAQTGGGLTGYRVTLVDSGQSWSVGADATSYTLNGVTVPQDGEAVYRVTVTAVNQLGEATSEVASGTLRYQTQNISATLSAGRVLGGAPPFAFHSYNVQARGLDADREYVVVCFADGRANGRDTVSGAELLRGWQDGDSDECAAGPEDRNLAVEIYDDRGRHVATTNVVRRWGG